MKRERERQLRSSLHGSSPGDRNDRNRSTKCNKCGFCVDMCFNYVLTLGEGRGVLVRYPEQCCVCGHCVAVCPENALVHLEMDSEKFDVLPASRIPPEQMRDLLLSRRSIRSFKEKPVPKELIEQLIEVGIHAGTSSNGQTEEFIVLQNREFLRSLEEKVIDVLWNKGLSQIMDRLQRGLFILAWGAAGGITSGGLHLTFYKCLLLCY